MNTSDPVQFGVVRLPCPKCGAIVPVLSSARREPVPILCQPCAQQATLAAKPDLEVEQQRLRDQLNFNHYRSISEELYRDTDPDHPTLKHNAEVIARILLWRPYSNGRGIVIQGPSASGKTRVMWLLIKDLIMSHSIQVQAIREVEFFETYRDLYRARDESAYLSRLKNARVLFIDDIGVSKPTETYKENFYNLIEHRRANRLPILCTTNLSKADFLERIGPSGDRIINRISEMCEAHYFNLPS